MIKFTVTNIAKVPDGKHADALGPNLYLHARNGGASKAWLFRYRLNGTPCELSIGPLRRVTIADARIKATALRAILDTGVDPKHAPVIAPLTTFKDDSLSYFEHHGLTGHPAHEAWRKAKVKCRRVTCGEYKYFGGNGVTFSDAWNDFNVFWAEMGATWEQGLCLGRIGNRGNYEPGNCAWVNRSDLNGGRKIEGPQRKSKVTRLEIHDHTAWKMVDDYFACRYVNRDLRDVEFSYQDGGHTLKIFVKED
jgi:hypothetical protein